MPVIGKCLSSLVCLSLALVLSACTYLPEYLESVLPPSHVVIPVAYATSRNVTSGDAPRSWYGGDYDTPSYGVASVALTTKAKPSSRHADWTRWQALRGVLNKKKKVLHVDAMNKATFDIHLEQRAGAMRERSVLVYVHGYAQTFKDTAIAAALLSYRLNFNGTVVLYSWPSLGSPVAYGQDVSNMQRSASHLRDLLADLATNTEFEQVHVIAHSLGNQGLMQALSRPASTGHETPADAWSLGQIALVAPDLDAEQFRLETAPWLYRTGSRVTLYVSQLDIPLLASAVVNQGRRVGDATARVLVAPGIETIDSTPVTNPFAAHLAHLHNTAILTDLRYLLNEQLAAAERPTLRAANGADGRYWRAQHQRLVAVE